MTSQGYIQGSDDTAGTSSYGGLQFLVNNNSTPLTALTLYSSGEVNIPHQQVQLLQHLVILLFLVVLVIQEVCVMAWE